jgi:putative ABC transport system permease protein
MRVIALIALRNLFQAKRRSALLGSAISLVTGMLVLLLSIGAGIEDNLVEAATMLGGGHVNVSGFYKYEPTKSAPMITDVAALREIVEKETPNLDYVLSRHRGWTKVISAGGSLQSALTGIVFEEEHRLLEKFQIIEGDPSKIERPHTVILFASHAKTLDVTVGDVVTFQTDPAEGYVNTMDSTVVAIARDVGMLSNWNVFVPFDDVLELSQLDGDTTGALWVYLTDIDKSTDTMNHMRTVFEEHGYRVMDHMSAPFYFKFDIVAGEDWTGQKLDLTIWEDEVSFLTWVITAFRTVAWALTMVLVGIIAVGIMNALWSAVRERTNEIGTMRAIGMTKRRVLAMIVLEALFLGLIATTIGAVGGAILALGIDAAAIPIESTAVQFILLADQVHLVVSPLAVVSAILLLTFFTALSSLLPARRAAALPPITAIHRVE